MVQTVQCIIALVYSNFAKFALQHQMMHTYCRGRVYTTLQSNIHCQTLVHTNLITFLNSLFSRTSNHINEECVHALAITQLHL